MYGVYGVVIVTVTAELHSSTAESIHTQMERDANKPFTLKARSQTMSETHEDGLVVTFLGFLNAQRLHWTQHNDSDAAFRQSFSHNLSCFLKLVCH